MKKLLSFLLVFSLVSSSGFAAFAQTPSGMENFKSTNTYNANHFTDVPASSWYAENVKIAYQLSLVNGTGTSTFSPNANITIAETITLASRLNNIYNGNTYSFVSSGVWYQTYVDYAVNKGIIKANEYSNFNAYATRAQFARIFASALPNEALTAINNIPDNAIPDVPIQLPCAPAVYKLYRAGVLTGNDSNGTFTPDTYIQRSAVAAIVSRMAKPAMRQSFALGNSSSTTSTKQSYAFDTLKNFIKNNYTRTVSVTEERVYEEKYGNTSDYCLYSLTYDSVNDNIIVNRTKMYYGSMTRSTIYLTTSGKTITGSFIYSNPEDTSMPNFTAFFSFDASSFNEEYNLQFSNIIGNSANQSYLKPVATRSIVDSLVFTNHILSSSNYSISDFGFNPNKFPSNSTYAGTNDIDIIRNTITRYSTPIDGYLYKMSTGVTADGYWSALVYDSKEDQIYIEVVNTFENGDKIVNLIYLDGAPERSTNKNRVVYMCIEANGDISTGSADINPATFRENSTISFHFYNSPRGNLVKAEDQKLSAALSRICLSEANRILKFYNNPIKMRDLGFIYF